MLREFWAPAKGMLILGIDPGSSITACGLVDSQSKQTFFNYIKLKKNLNQNEKLYSVYKFILRVLKDFQPQEVAIETPFYSVNIQSAMLLSEIKAASIIAAKEEGLDVFQYTPREIKQAICGYGAADKNQIKFVVEKTLKINLKEMPFDVSDALAVALTHIYTKHL